MNLDCGWTTGFRDNTTGELQVDHAKFPDMAAYGAGLRARGMLFGMYAGGWHAQCCHRGMPGGNDTSWQHWDVDAATFRRWGIDYLKSDPCCGRDANTTAPLTPADVFNEYNAQWDAAFRRVGYGNFDIILAIFGPPERVVWALDHPTHAVDGALLGCHADWMLIGACDLML